MRRGLVRARRVVVAIVLLAALAAGLAYALLRASLPEYDGAAKLAGLAQPVAVSRDALGVATVAAATRVDAMRALGYVHAQDRYFEMDLTRRAAAGELAALFGAAALPMDRARRVHRFRARAAAEVARMRAEDRAVLEAYVDGVNAGLAALAVRPFPYLLVRRAPIAWRAEDSLLCGYAMYFDLQGGDNARERALGAMRAELPATLVDFLTAAGTEWDAPLDGEAYPDPPLPPPTDVDLRTLPAALFERGQVAVGGDFGLGSNNFAVSGAHTANGAALVANDPHLQLRVPNVWYRARLRYGSGEAAVDVTGVTLPGVPALVLGSNGHVAWAFTNSYVDAMDDVRVRWRDAARSVYATDGRSANVEQHVETLEVADGDAETLTVRETVYGPIVVDDWRGSGTADAPHGESLALAWIAHRPGALDFALNALETARTVDQAVAIAQRAGVPAQNFVVGDAGGRIAYTLIGRLPKRTLARPVDPAGTMVRDIDWRGWREPSSWSAVDGDPAAHAAWDGWLDAADYPHLEPADGRLWTANSRTVSGDAYARIGDGGTALGARARQIRDDLRAREQFAPADLLAIQLDDRTLFMQRWWALLRETLAARGRTTAGATDSGGAHRAAGIDRADGGGDAARRLADLEAATQTWDERATPEARSYRFARAFRLRVHEIVLDGLVAPMRAQHPDFAMPLFAQAEGIVWKLVRERPAHLLAPIYADWDALLLAAATRVATELADQPGGLAARTWGERNTSAIRHPLSRAVPPLARFLDMPARALAGDSGMPRVQAPAFGASFRCVVAPGHEDQGLMHMPGGQSGHPLSPYYGAGHADWEAGAPTPFLPGPAERTLTLSP